MGIAAAQIGFDHEAGEDVRVACEEAGGFEGPLDECRQRSRLNAWNIGATLLVACCAAVCWAISPPTYSVCRYVISIEG